MPNLIPLRLYSNNGISTWRKCARLYYFTHVRFWKPIGPKLDLVFGSSWHAAMDVIWAGAKTPDKESPALIDRAYDAFTETWTELGLPHPDEISPDDLDFFTPKTPQIAHEMLYEYWDARQHIFKDPSFELIDIERPFAVPLDPNDETLWYIGKLDKIFRFRNQVVIGEHKSTRSYKKDGPFRSEYVDGFDPNSQVDGYLFAQHDMFSGTNKIGGVWIDAALAHKSVHDGFMFIPIEKKIEHLDAWLWETHYYIDQLEGNLEVLEERSAADTSYMAAFPKNTDSCGNFGGCPYRDICRAFPHPGKIEEPPPGFKYDRHTSWDEVKLEKLGFTVDRNGQVAKEISDDKDSL